MDEKIKIGDSKNNRQTLRRKPPKIPEQELTGGTQNPSWMSSNEGVHERVNFDDTLWGFELAGGAYYDTPLRVTKVKPDSRAQLAGIHVGDKLKSINGIATNTLTVLEAHDLILDCGIEIKLNFYAPDVEETMYYVYQDEIDNDRGEAKGLEEFEDPVCDLSYKGGKVNQTWSVVWPCNKKRDILYKESNCYMVTSTYEVKHPKKLLKNEPVDVDK